MLTAGRRSGSILILACTMAGAMTAWVFLLGSPFTAIFPGALLGGLLVIDGEELMEMVSRLKTLLKEPRPVRSGM